MAEEVSKKIKEKEEIGKKIKGRIKDEIRAMIEETAESPEYIEDLYQDIIEELKKEKIPYLLGNIREPDKFHATVSLTDPDNWIHFMDVLFSVKPKLVYLNPWEFDEESPFRLAAYIIDCEKEDMHKTGLGIDEKMLGNVEKAIASKIEKKYRRYYGKYERLTVGYMLDGVYHHLSIIPAWAEDMFFDAVTTAKKMLGRAEKFKIAENMLPESTELKKGQRPSDIYR